MEDGLPKRSDYRRFKVRHQDGQDDFASMEEVLTRRFRRYLDERDEGARAGKRFSYPPNLLLDRRRQGPARGGGAGARGAGAGGHRGASAGQAVRGGVPARRARSGADPPRLARRSTCSSRYATRPTGSRSPTTASCGRSDRPRRSSTTSPVSVRSAHPAAQGVRLGEGAAGADRRGFPWRCPGCRTRCAATCTPRCTASPCRAVARHRSPLRATYHHLRSDPPPTNEFPTGLDVTIITGMSGAGRSTAADVLEDLGFFVIDNLPPALIPKVVELARGGTPLHRYGFGVDVRSGSFVARPRAGTRRAARARRPDPGGVPRRLGRRAGPTLRGDPSTASSGRRRTGARRHPEGAGAPRGVEGAGRPRGRHQSNLNVPRLRDRLHDLFADDAVRGHAADERRVVRLQARHPGRRRPGVRLPVPARIRTGSTNCARSTAATREFGTTCSGSRRVRRSSTSSSGCSRSCCRRTSTRARRTCRSASDAPAAVTAAS